MDEGVTFGNLLGSSASSTTAWALRVCVSSPPTTLHRAESRRRGYIEGIGWIEMGAPVSSARSHRTVRYQLPVLAWGLGVSRIAMLSSAQRPPVPSPE